MGYLRYKDSKGRWAKYDKRKKLVQYVYNQKGFLMHRTGLTKAKDLNNNPKVHTFDTIAHMRKEAQQMLLEPKRYRYFESQTFDKTDNSDIHTYFAKQGINKIVASMQKKHKGKIIIARVTVRCDGDKLVSREVPLTGVKKEFGKTAKTGRKGKQYQPANLLAYAVHDSMNQQQYSPYYQNTSGGQPQVDFDRNYESQYDWTRHQTYQVSFRAVSIRSARHLFRPSSTEPR